MLTSFYGSLKENAAACVNYWAQVKRKTIKLEKPISFGFFRVLKILITKAQSKCNNILNSYFLKSSLLKKHDRNCIFTIFRKVYILYWNLFSFLLMTTSMKPKISSLDIPFKCKWTYSKEVLYLDSEMCSIWKFLIWEYSNEQRITLTNSSTFENLKRIVVT